LIDIIEM